MPRFGSPLVHQILSWKLAQINLNQPRNLLDPLCTTFGRVSDPFWTIAGLLLAISLLLPIVPCGPIPLFGVSAAAIVYLLLASGCVLLASSQGRPRPGLAQAQKGMGLAHLGPVQAHSQDARPWQGPMGQARWVRPNGPGPLCKAQWAKPIGPSPMARPGPLG